MLEGPTDGLVDGDGHVSAEDDGRHQPGPDPGVVVDLVLQQRDEDAGALRVADHGEAPPGVVIGEIRLPGVEHIRVGERLVGRSDVGRAGEHGQRDLSVQRCVDVADLREAGGLGHGHSRLLRVEIEVGVGRGLGAHRRVDVEAVDLGPGDG